MEIMLFFSITNLDTFLYTLYEVYFKPDIKYFIIMEC